MRTSGYSNSEFREELKDESLKSECGRRLRVDINMHPQQTWMV